MPLTVETLTAKNGQTTLRLHLEDGRAIHLHSAYDPEREARQWADSQTFGPNDVVVLFGCGAGHAAAALRPRLSRNNHILILDPLASQVPAGIEPLEHLLKDPRIHQAGNLAGFRAAYDRIENACWKGLSLLRLPAYEQFFPDLFAEISVWTKRQSNSLKVHRDTVFASARGWQHNLFRNLVQLPGSGAVMSAFGALQGKPAIIVSAGPSLSRNMHLLEQACDRALIIATGTAARLLALKGLPYHLVVSVDPNPVNWHAHFEGIQHTKAVLVYDVTTTPKVVAEHPHSKAAFYSLPDCRWLGEFFSPPPGLLKTGGSVANIAFDLAVKLGADPVILIGQDLAYTDGLSNAPGTYQDRFVHHVPSGWFEGTQEELERLATQRPGLSYLLGKGRIAVPGFDGSQVWTDRSLFGFLCWFEDAIRELGGTPRVIDATEGGALIRGTEVRTFLESLTTDCRESIADDIAAVCSVLSEPVCASQAPLIRFLESSLAELESLVKTCAESIEMLQAGRGSELGRIEAGTLDRIERLKRILHFSLVPVLVRLMELPPVGSEGWTGVRASFWEYLNKTVVQDRAALEQTIRELRRPAS